MKKLLSLFLALCLLLGLTACGQREITADENPAISDLEDHPSSAEKSDAPDVSEPDVPETDKPPTSADETAAPDRPATAIPKDTTPAEQPSTQEPTATAEAEKKILIAYFTWADNTHVDDPSSVDPTIDAASSASIVAPGDTARLAGWIQQEVGGTLHVLQLLPLLCVLLHSLVCNSGSFRIHFVYPAPVGLKFFVRLSILEGHELTVLSAFTKSLQLQTFRLTWPSTEHL